MSEALLICTDLDRTLIPNGPQPEPEGARKLFARLAARPEVTLVFVSGRHRELIEKALTTYALPIPDYVIGDVGTTMYHVGPQHAWVHVDTWEEQIATDWAGHRHEELRNALRDVPHLRLQERGKQNRLKLSFYLPMHADIDALTLQIRERLQPLGLRYRLIWSVDDIADIGLLDVLPERASKLHAIEALARMQGFANSRIVFCGDSGNDLEVLASHVPAVLVANSRADVQDLALELAEEAGTLKQLYIAEGGFRGMNGNYAGGMLEGIVHYHPEVAAWLDDRPGDDYRGTVRGNAA
jgi:HAD superfamily hydrolase (TIGR01484 family)